MGKGWMAELLVLVGGLILAAGFALIYLPAGVIACGLLIAAAGIAREVR